MIRTAKGHIQVTIIEPFENLILGLAGYLWI